MVRKNILVLAYSVSPDRGSEYSVGWSYIKEMSRDHNLIVLYGLAGDHMGDTYEVENNPTCLALTNVEWIAVRPNWLTSFLNGLNKRGLLVYSFYISYRFWHKQAYQTAKKIVQSRSIDLIHYLGPIGFREPGYLWKIDKPYIWGPVSGMENRSLPLAYGKGKVVAVKILIRNLVNTLQFRFGSRVRRAFARANLLLSATSSVQKMILDVHSVSSLLQAENAIPDEMLDRQRLVTMAPGECLNIIWVGSIDERKSLSILLKALSKIDRNQWHLSVIGDGPLRAVCTDLALDLGINSRISWVGKVARGEVSQHYLHAHVHVISSLLEGNPTVIWEAMSYGVPTISLDHFGMHDTICEHCGIRTQVGSTLQLTIDAMTRAILRLIESPQLVEQLSSGVRSCSRKYTWSVRREKWNNHYEAAIDNWHKSSLRGLR